MSTSSLPLVVLTSNGDEEGDSASSRTGGAESELQLKALDFRIEKTFATLNEIEKQGNRALIAYAALIAIATVLAFGAGFVADTKVAIPFLGLAVDKGSGALITLQLSPLALYWFYANLAMRNLLAKRVSQLFSLRYRDIEMPLWHLRYPSMLGVSISLATTDRRLDRAFSYILGLFFMITLTAPTLIAHQVAVSLGYGVVFVAGLMLAAALPPILFAWTMTTSAGDEKIEASLAALDEGRPAPVTETDGRIFVIVVMALVFVVLVRQFGFWQTVVALNVFGYVVGACRFIVGKVRRARHRRPGRPSGRRGRR